MAPRPTRAAIGPKTMPYGKYRALRPLDLQDRTWPQQQMQAAPRFCSVDLRDGNQALLEPMSPAEKLTMFELLLEVGFKEIEVGFPAASQPDFDFVRRIIDDGLIPEDVTIQVLCQAREELIRRTVEAVDGAPSVIFHLYNSTSKLQRDVVFGMEKDGITGLAVNGTRLVREVTRGLSADTDLTLQYSPESFTGTEVDYAIEISSAVVDAWGPEQDEQVIINLPATVEMFMPNLYADMIEYFCRNFPGREQAVISLHTHNDRGTGVAATELALLAGADRVEGTLFGNGERTGNLDIVTVAMNLFSQGINPTLDFSNMPRVVEIAEACTRLPVHPRHPWAGELVFTAFSGSHQDAIRKGMAKVDPEHWEVPYLPIDPADVGQSYRETVRVNSQSGKGGVAFILEHHHGITLSRDHLIEFAGVVQQLTEGAGGELSPGDIWDAFRRTYVSVSGPFELLDYDLSTTTDDGQQVQATLRVRGEEVAVKGTGNGPIAAFVDALRQTLNEVFTVADYHEHAVSEGADAEACALVTLRDGDGGLAFGAAMSANTVTASLQAVVSALNRRWAD